MIEEKQDWRDKLKQEMSVLDWVFGLLGFILGVFVTLILTQ